jgi:uncharacterized YigZ family protein
LTTTFKTIAQRSEAELLIKKSRFLSFAFPVKNEIQVKAALDEVKSLHLSAKHVCYAYRLGANKDIWKANDAGEPANTAGQPIHGQLKSFDLTNVIIIVVRYFGGIKLVVGGLISAYKEAAALALANARVIENFEKHLVIFEVPLNSVARTEYFLKNRDAEVVEKVFYETCRFTVNVAKENFTIFVEELKQLTIIKTLQ